MKICANFRRIAVIKFSRYSSKSRKGSIMNKPSWSYWSVSAMGLLWNLMGCVNYLAQTNAGVLEHLPEDVRNQILSRPAWATAAVLTAVFAGAVGSILLLLRRKVAEQVLSLSVLGAVVAMVYAITVFGLSLTVLLSAGTSVLVAAILFWLARSARVRAWLR
jgi:nitrate reductase gamma subunit